MRSGRRVHLLRIARRSLEMATAASVEGLGKRLAPELPRTDAALPYLAEALAPPPGQHITDRDSPSVEESAEGSRRSFVVG